MIALLKQRLTIPAIFFGLVSIVWLVTRTSPLSIVALALGLFLGTFLLDTDVLIYYLFFNPDHEVATQIKLLLDHKDYKGLINLLFSRHLEADNYIFHHIQFILALSLVSLFVFTTSTSILGTSLVLAIHFHLLDDISASFRSSPARLQSWLFARMDKQIKENNLRQIMFGYLALVFFFAILLIRLGL